MVLETGNKALFCFRGIHSNDQDHEIFKDIESAFDRFKADYVLVEGDFNDDKYNSLKTQEKPVYMENQLMWHI